MEPSPGRVENNRILGWDDSIAVLEELIAEDIKQKREMERSYLSLCSFQPCVDQGLSAVEH
jgi:hypothetical protein